MSFSSSIYQSSEQLQAHIIYQYFEKWSSQVVQQIKVEKLEEKLVFVDFAAETFSFDNKQQLLPQLLHNIDKNKNLRQMLLSIWNTTSPTLEQEIADTIATTTKDWYFEPFVQLADTTWQLPKELQKVTHLPTFALVDSWNNEFADTAFLSNLVDHDGDCLLHFDYKKVIAAIPRAKHQDRLQRLFGVARLEQLRIDWLQKPSRKQKEQLVHAAFCRQLETTLGIIAPPFCYDFYDEKDKAAYGLFFLTKQPFAYELMRKVMTKSSQVLEDGIGSFSYRPALADHQVLHQNQTLFGAMFELEQQLVKTFRKKTLQVKDVYANFHWGRTYIKQNYLDALKNLDKKQQISIKRRPNRFGNLPPIGERTFVSFNR